MLSRQAVARLLTPVLLMTVLGEFVMPAGRPVWTWVLVLSGASNLGLPPNPALPFYKENTPDRFGYIANPSGLKFLDLGVGGFLAGPQNPNREWAAMAKSFLGKYKTPTLRNVDQRPRTDFVKAYMHNGYLKSLGLPALTEEC